MLPQQNGQAVKKRRITDVKVVSIEKRKDTKNLEFLLNVSWSNGETRTISRQYSMFFDLLGGIKMIFQDVHDVIIPDLPVPKFQVAMLFSSYAKKESRVIEEFCQKLIKLTPVISQSDVIEKFFSEWGTDAVYKESKAKISVPVSRPTPVDRRDNHVVERYRALASYQTSSIGEMQMIENEILTVIEKNQTGWWLVTNEKGQHGFAPATFLEPLDRETQSDAEEWVNYDGESRIWVAIQSYTAQSEDEVSYRKGDEMEVIAMSNIGWWKVRFHGKVGVTPASNLVAISIKQDKNSVFENPVYEDAPIGRRPSFTSVGTIYASIRKPPPRRDSSKKKMPPTNIPVKDATLAYASVYVTNDAFLASHPPPDDQDRTSDEDIYSEILPKHLRAPKSPKMQKKKIEDIYEEVNDEGPPPIPMCFVDETATLARRKDEEAEKEPQRRKSANELNSSDTKAHRYLNVMQGDEQKGTNLYRAVTEYQVPLDRHDDLPLPSGCVVRALTKDGTFFFVSTLDDPPRQGWVPEHVLENIQMKSNSAHRRSRSLGDLLTESLQSEPNVLTIKLKQLHNRTPVAAPRLDTRRYFSFDATNTKDDDHSDTASQEMVSEIQSLKVSSLKETETWFHGKMNRQSCEEHMLKSARELDFMIRESTQRFASYVLSVMFSKKVRHFPIETTPSKKFVIGRHAFDSLPAIVDFFTKNPLFYTHNKQPVSLGQPFVLY